MALTEFEQTFKNALLKITNDTDEIFATYLFAKTDTLRQIIINGINDGKFSDIDEIDEYICEYKAK